MGFPDRIERTVELAHPPGQVWTALTTAEGLGAWFGHEATIDAFFRDGDRVFRTYFVNNRGDEALGSTWSYLDLSALGRQEQWENSPEGYPQTPPYDWWNWHDEYDHPELAQGPMRRLAAAAATDPRARQGE